MGKRIKGPAPGIVDRRHHTYGGCRCYVLGLGGESEGAVIIDAVSTDLCYWPRRWWYITSLVVNKDINLLAIIKPSPPLTGGLVSAGRE